MLVQITMTRNELFLLKEMLPQWKNYADGFVFLDDGSTDGTYEFLQEHAAEYNILAVLRNDRSTEALPIESDMRQRLYDEALKFSPHIICLDTDEYLDGSLKKDGLEAILNANPDTLFYLKWVQYTGKYEIRVDGKWETHWVDRLATYSRRCALKPRQMHAEHIPVPSRTAAMDIPNLFVAHLQWLDKKNVAIKQYYWKIEDYVNKHQFGADVIDPREYDKSVNDFQWRCIRFQFPLKVNPLVYATQSEETNYRYQLIRERIKRFQIPNLNDWGMGIHG